MLEENLGVDEGPNVETVVELLTCVPPILAFLLFTLFFLLYLLDKIASDEAFAGTRAVLSIT